MSSWDSYQPPCPTTGIIIGPQPNFSALGRVRRGVAAALTAACVHHQMKLASFCMGDLVQCFPMDRQRPPLIARCGPLVRPYESRLPTDASSYFALFVAIF